MEPRARRAPPARQQQPEQPALRGQWRGRASERRRRGIRPGALPRQRRRAGRHEPGAGGPSAALDRPAGAQDPTGPHRADPPRRRARRERLVMLALWVLAALQSGPAPDVTARVDRSHVTAGDDLLLTIRARTRSAAPVTLALPALTGFTVVGSREVTEVTLEALGGPVRTTTRELELRAQRPGALVIGPVRVEQGGRRVTTAALTVTVDSARAGLATAVSPIARRLIAAATPPTHDEKGDHVGLSVLLPGDSVLVGQQLDVLAVAWFPRELRARLRRAPILTLQTPEGVWSYPGAAPSEVVASRLVRGRWLDLFVAHEAVFPLAPGRIFIPPATVEYAVPASLLDGDRKSTRLNSSHEWSSYAVFCLKTRKTRLMHKQPDNISRM